MSKLIRYFGGKGGMTKKLLSYMPIQRKVFVEPFGGSATLLFAQNTEIEIYNDIFNNVYTLFKVLSNKQLFEKFKSRCDLVYYSEAIRKEQKALLMQKDLSDVDRAFAYFYVNRTSHNGVGGFSINSDARRKMSKSVSDMLTAVDNLIDFHKRLSSVVIRNMDAIDCILKYDNKDTFMYLDPPYHHSTRGSARYQHDYTDEQHRKLIRTIKSCKSKILISGYDTPSYDLLLKNGFNKESFVVNTSSNGLSKQKTETVWFNYDK